MLSNAKLKLSDTCIRLAKKLNKQTNKQNLLYNKKKYTVHFFNVDVIYNFNSLTNEHFTSKLMVARAFSTVA